MEVGHVMYRASMVQKDKDSMLSYGRNPLDRTLCLERILDMNLCYSVLNGGTIIPFCFIDGRNAYVFKKNGMLKNPLFNFPSIFRGESLIKNKIPEFPTKSRLLHLISEYETELEDGGLLIGFDKEIPIPKFNTLNELKMKMEISGLCTGIYQRKRFTK